MCPSSGFQFEKPLVVYRSPIEYDRAFCHTQLTPSILGVSRPTATPKRYPLLAGWDSIRAPRTAADRGTGRSNFAGSCSAYSSTNCSASSSVRLPISRAASSAWKIQPPSIARLNLVRGFPCAGTALPVGPRLGFVGPDGYAQPRDRGYARSCRHPQWISRRLSVYDSIVGPQASGSVRRRSFQCPTP